MEYYKNYELLSNSVRVALNVGGKMPLLSTNQRNKLPKLKEIYNKDINGAFLFPLKDIFIIDIDRIKGYEKGTGEFKRKAYDIALKSGTTFQQTASGSIHLFYINDINHYIGSTHILEKITNKKYYGDFRTGKANNETSTGVRYVGLQETNKLKPLSQSKIGKALLKQKQQASDDILNSLLDEPTTKVIYSDEKAYNSTPYDFIINYLNIHETSHSEAWGLIYGVINEFKNDFKFNELWELLKEELTNHESNQDWLNNEADKWFTTKELEAQILYEEK